MTLNDGWIGTFQLTRWSTALKVSKNRNDCVVYLELSAIYASNNSDWNFGYFDSTAIIHKTIDAINTAQKACEWTWKF